MSTTIGMHEDCFNAHLKPCDYFASLSTQPSRDQTDIEIDIIVKL